MLRKVASKVMHALLRISVFYAKALTTMLCKGSVKRASMGPLQLISRLGPTLNLALSQKQLDLKLGSQKSQSRPPPLTIFQCWHMN